MTMNKHKAAITAKYLIRNRSISFYPKTNQRKGSIFGNRIKFWDKYDGDCKVDVLSEEEMPEKAGNLNHLAFCLCQMIFQEKSADSWWSKSLELTRADLCDKYKFLTTLAGVCLMFPSLQPLEGLNNQLCEKFFNDIESLRKTAMEKAAAQIHNESTTHEISNTIRALNEHSFFAFNGTKKATHHRERSFLLLRACVFQRWLLVSRRADIRKLKAKVFQELGITDPSSLLKFEKAGFGEGIMNADQEKIQKLKAQMTGLKNAKAQITDIEKVSKSTLDALGKSLRQKLKGDKADPKKIEELNTEIAGLEKASESSLEGLRKSLGREPFQQGKKADPEKILHRGVHHHQEIEALKAKIASLETASELALDDLGKKLKGEQADREKIHQAKVETLEAKTASLGTASDLALDDLGKKLKGEQADREKIHQVKVETLEAEVARLRKAAEDKDHRHYYLKRTMEELGTNNQKLAEENKNLRQSHKTAMLEERASLKLLQNEYQNLSVENYSLSHDLQREQKKRKLTEDRLRKAEEAFLERSSL